ncbi:MULTISPECIES: NAD(P)-dependent oxidoreductase [Paenibacillus]|uniref:NAD(P)-dependent oxidoreductase n=1 Tax=Paenibacillus TaxID=44249 RepID=UPI0004705661|nr:NAD(P)H-binding protein [Paenibacillus massiliensis]
MNIIVFGATGRVGQAIVKELLKRKHQVTAAVRDVQRLGGLTGDVKVVEVDLLSLADVTEAARGHELIISAYGPRFGAEDELVEVARILIEAAKKAQVPRILVVGGAGSLKTGSGELLMDTLEFPEEARPLALAHAEAFTVISQADVIWTYFSPAAVIKPGLRTGNFRIGTDWLVTDELGYSRISIEDYAVALVDEAEEAEFVNARFTVGY